MSFMKKEIRNERKIPEFDPETVVFELSKVSKET